MEQTLRQRAEALLELASKRSRLMFDTDEYRKCQNDIVFEAPYLAQKLIEALDVLEKIANSKDPFYVGTVNHQDVARQFLQERSE